VLHCELSDNIIPRREVFHTDGGSYEKIVQEVELKEQHPFNFMQMKMV